MRTWVYNENGDWGDYLWGELQPSQDGLPHRMAVWGSHGEQMGPIEIVGASDDHGRVTFPTERNAFIPDKMSIFDGEIFTFTSSVYYRMTGLNAKWLSPVDKRKVHKVEITFEHSDLLFPEMALNVHPIPSDPIERYERFTGDKEILCQMATQEICVKIVASESYYGNAANYTYKRDAVFILSYVQPVNFNEALESVFALRGLVSVLAASVVNIDNVIYVTDIGPVHVHHCAWKGIKGNKPSPVPLRGGEHIQLLRGWIVLLQDLRYLEVLESLLGLLDPRAMTSQMMGLFLMAAVEQLYSIDGGHHSSLSVAIGKWFAEIGLPSLKVHGKSIARWRSNFAGHYQYLQDKNNYKKNAKENAMAVSSSVDLLPELIIAVCLKRLNVDIANWVARMASKAAQSLPRAGEAEGETNGSEF